MDNRQEILRARVRQKAAVVVQLIDDFTEKPIRPGMVTVSSEQVSRPPIYKEDGLCVFLNCDQERLTIRAESPFYHSQTRDVVCTELPPLMPVVRIRLTPNRNYPLPAHAASVEGVALPGSEIRMYCSDLPHPLRMMEDYSREKANRVLYLFDKVNADLEGRFFALVRKDAAKAEFFTVSSRVENDEGGYRIEKPLRTDCKKTGTLIYPAYTAYADQNGTFFLPLLMMGMQKGQCTIWVRNGAKGKKWTEYTVQLETGKTTRLQLTHSTGREDG